MTQTKQKHSKEDTSSQAPLLRERVPDAIDLEPIGDDQEIVGYVPHVNGNEAMPCPEYQPTRFELRELARMWWTRRRMNDDFFLWTRQTGSTEWRENIYAERRIERITAVIGKEETQEIMSQVDRESGFNETAPQASSQDSGFQTLRRESREAQATSETEEHLLSEAVTSIEVRDLTIDVSRLELGQENAFYCVEIRLRPEDLLSEEEPQRLMLDLRNLFRLETALQQAVEAVTRDRDKQRRPTMLSYQPQTKNGGKKHDIHNAHNTTTHESRRSTG